MWRVSGCSLQWISEILMWRWMAESCWAGVASLGNHDNTSFGVSSWGFDAVTAWPLSPAARLWVVVRESCLMRGIGFS